MRVIEEELIVGIDIGSSKIVAVISEIDDTGSISIIGVGRADSHSGVRSGVVVNIEAVVTALNEAIEAAEIQAGREITSVFVGISGSNIESINSNGVVAIAGHDKEIRESDIERVIEAAKAVNISMDREILHIIPQGFIVDGQSNIKYPVGMVGTRLECNIHIVTTAISSIQNVVKSLNRAGLEVSDIVLQNLASSRAILTGDEKEIGVLVIDIGAQTSKVSIFNAQAPFFDTIYPLGGYLITNDLSAGLKVSYQNAEKIKISHGVTDINYVDRDEKIQIPSIGGRSPRLIARAHLIHIIKPRVEEMLRTIKTDIINKGFMDLISGGVVLTGGTALLPGIVEVCQEVFELPCRVGYPKKFAGFGEKIYSPEYAVAAGLILWGNEESTSSDEGVKELHRTKSKGGFMKAVKNFFEDFF